MVTKGIIQSINFNGNTCTIRLPFFETTHNDPIVITATFSNTPGMYNGYKVNDVVWVAFEDGQMETPVVIGKLYLGAEKEKADPRGTVNTEAFTVSKTAAIPADTYLRSNTDKEIPNTAHPYGSLSTVANDLNLLNKDVEYHNWYNENKFKNIISLANGKSTTYYSETDPSKDPNITLNKGDTWFNTKEPPYYNIGKLENRDKYVGKWIDNPEAGVEKYAEVTKENIDTLIPDASNLPIAYEKAALFEWDGRIWHAVDNDIVANKVTAAFVNALNITAKKIEVKDNNDTLFLADGLNNKHEVKIAGFTVDKNSISNGTTGEENSVLVSTGTENEYKIGNSAEQNGWAITAGSTFGVTKQGNLYASGGDIGGWNITNKSLQKTYQIPANDQTETYKSILGADYKKEVYFGEDSHDDTWSILLGKDTATNKFDGTFGITNNGLVFTNKLNIFGGTVAIDPVFRADDSGLYISRSTNKVVELDADNITADHIASSNTADFAKALTDTSIVEELNIAPDKYAESSTENPALKISSKNIGGSTKECTLISEIKELDIPETDTIRFTVNLLTGTTESGHWRSWRLSEDISVQITCIGYVKYKRSAEVTGIRMVTASGTKTLTKGGQDFQFKLSANVPGLREWLKSPAPRVTVSPDKLILNTGVTVTFSATKLQITKSGANYKITYDLITDKTLPADVDEDAVQYILVGDVYKVDNDERIQTGVNLLPAEPFFKPSFKAGQHSIENIEQTISNQWPYKTGKVYVYFKNVQVKFYDKYSKEKWVDNLELDISGTFYNSVISSTISQNNYPNDILIYGNLVPTERSYLYPEQGSDEDTSPLLGTMLHPWTVYADKINLKGGISPVGRACILGEPDQRLNNIYTSTIGDETSRVDDAWTTTIDTRWLKLRDGGISPVSSNTCDIGEPGSLIRNIYTSNLKVKTIEGASANEPVESIYTANLTVNGKKALLAPDNAQLYIEAGITNDVINEDQWLDIWKYNPNNITVISVTANPIRESDLNFSGVGIAVGTTKVSTTEWWVKLGNDGIAAKATYIIVYKYK